MIPAHVHGQPSCFVVTRSGRFSFHGVAAPIGGLPWLQIDRPLRVEKRP